MRECDYNRVEFHSKEDLSVPRHLKNGELILTKDIEADYAFSFASFEDTLQRYII